MKNLIFISVDFDGTLAEHKYPEIGKEVPLAFEYLKKFKEAGCKIFLWTVRSDYKDRKVLTEAVDYCKSKGIEFDGINKNPWQDWSNSPKIYANVYIDDAAVGCPLVHPWQNRPYVDWSVVGPEVMKKIEKIKKEN